MYKKPILAFPYHDPNGKYNDILKQQLPELQGIFSEICVSTTAITAQRNLEMVDFLKTNQCVIYINNETSEVGDHYRAALRLAFEKAQSGQSIFFSFIDRVLFQMLSDHKADFLSAMSDDMNRDCLIYERPDTIWKTYPNAYREMEKSVSRIGSLLYGQEIEYNYCAAMIGKEFAEYILLNSDAKHFNVAGEWVLLYFVLNGRLPKTKKVDWLAWEDPFWEKMSLEALKAQRECDQTETINRIKSNASFISLFTEERFLKK